MTTEPTRIIADAPATTEAERLLNWVSFALKYSPETLVAVLGPDLAGLSARLGDALEAAGALDL